MGMLKHMLDLAMFPATEIPASPLNFARFSLFDWLVVGRAGTNEPLSGHIRNHVLSEGGYKVASLFGGGRCPARSAALANGTIAHALDYDDTHFAHVGHMSVAIYPAALAVGEEMDAEISDVTAAFLIGAEVSIRLGLALGRGHYLRGFHQTATSGAFGATVAAGRLYGLDRDQMTMALGLCATRASGLKSQFGTMGKPYNAGIAASNGVECAALARAGFTSCADGLEGPQGFIETHADAPDPAAFWQDPPPEHFRFEDIKYKFHACCHGTHAMIEALADVQRSNKVPIDEIDAIRLRTNPRWLQVCDIKAPKTGLEIKFSYVWLAAMVLSGISTSADREFDDARTKNPKIKNLAAKISVTGENSLTDLQAEGEITMVGGRSIAFSYDLAQSLPIKELSRRLMAKAKILSGDEKAAKFWQACVNDNQGKTGDLGDLLE